MHLTALLLLLHATAVVRVNVAVVLCVHVCCVFTLP